MRCTAYCTASSYNIAALFQYLKHHFVSTIYRDAIHVVYPTQQADIFFFSYGVIVAWGLSQEDEVKLIEQVKEFAIEPIGIVVKDEYDFCYGDAWRIQRDEIVLTTKEPLTKLAVSYGLAQSAKLALFEETINKTIANTRNLPEDMAKKGKIFLSRKAISQKIGELFIDRSSVNFHYDILDEPEFFWEYPEHHSIYRDTAKCLDISTRVDVLNKRLSIVGELLGILHNQLNHQHTSILEWTIIWLIVIEVVLALLHDLFHLI